MYISSQCCTGREAMEGRSRRCCGPRAAEARVCQGRRSPATLSRGSKRRGGREQRNGDGAVESADSSVTVCCPLCIDVVDMTLERLMWHVNRFHKVTNPKVLDEMECQTKTLFAGKATKSKPPSGSRLPSPPPSAPAEETDGEVVVVNEEEPENNSPDQPRPQKVRKSVDHRRENDQNRRNPDSTTGSSGPREVEPTRLQYEYISPDQSNSKPKERTESDDGFSSKIVKYQCSNCPFTSYPLEKIQAHFYSEHSTLDLNQVRPTKLTLLPLLKRLPDQEQPEHDMSDSPFKTNDSDLGRFQSGDLVWARLSGHPWWPSMIIPDPASTRYRRGKQAQYHVLFFDQENHMTRGWVPQRLLELFDSGRQKFCLRRKHKSFKAALEWAKLARMWSRSQRIKYFRPNMRQVS